MPESPWWLVSKNRDDKAPNGLCRLGYSQEERAKELANVKVTHEDIKRETEGVTYLECFRRSNLRRTIISIAPLSIQALSGVVSAAGYSSYYIQLAGYSTAMSFRLQIAQQVCSLVGNVMSYFLIDKVGRRNVMLYGLDILTVILILTGGLAVVGADTSNPNSGGAIKGTVALILI